MKAHNNLFEKTCSFESLLSAYKRAKRGKSRRESVARFNWRLEAHILRLSEELLAGAYRPGFYRSFIVHDAKKRHIQAAPFRDRVVHQSVHATLEPVFEKSFIFDSYACRKGKGTWAAIAQFERYTRSGGYVLQGDISKYFASIDHAILLRLLAKRVRDTRMLALCESVIKSSEDAPGKGIPIGNLTSQLFANVYLNELDQFVKHTLRAKKYIRYMDDFVLASDSKAQLHYYREQIEAFVTNELKLELHPKKVQVVPASGGIDYLGYRIFPRYRKLRKSTVQRFLARTRRARKQDAEAALPWESIQSWLVYARGAQSRGLLRSIAKRENLPLLTMYK